MGALDDAQDVFNKLMDLEFDYVSENKHLYNEFGIRMRKGGMHEQALQWYRKALGCCNMDPHLYYNVGRLQYELRDYSMARDSLQKALELEPELEPAVKLPEAGAQGPWTAAGAGGPRNLFPGLARSLVPVFLRHGLFNQHHGDFLAYGVDHGARRAAQSFLFSFYFQVALAFRAGQYFQKILVQRHWCPSCCSCLVAKADAARFVLLHTCRLPSISAMTGPGILPANVDNEALGF